MTYTSPTPEESFDELEELVQASELRDAVDEQALCTAFRSKTANAVVYAGWACDAKIRSFLPNGYDHVLMHRVDSHVLSCHSCRHQVYAVIPALYAPLEPAAVTAEQMEFSRRVLQARLDRASKSG